MNVGLSVDSRTGAATTRDLMRNITERVTAARDAGLRSLHVGDKHGVNEPYAANFVTAAHMASHWPHRLGVLVVNSMWNPVILAEQIATLAALTSHLDVVVAIGDGEDHFGSVGVPIADRVPLFLDGLAVVRSLLDGEEVTAQVGHYTIRQARVVVRDDRDQGDASDQRRDPEISWWFAANAPVAIRRAARMADGWLASAKLTPAEAAQSLDIYRSAGGVGKAVLRRDVFVGADHEEVRIIAEPAVRAAHRGYPTEALVRGTADEVVDEFIGFAKVGFDEILVRSLVLPQDHALRSIARLGEVVAQTG